MKTRIGFVSNSSSSSFILRNKSDITEFKKMYKETEIYSVNEIILKLEKAIECLKLPYFIGELYTDLENKLEEFRNLKGCYLTEPIDRDKAYLQDINFDVFKGDL